MAGVVPVGMPGGKGELIDSYAIVKPAAFE